MDIKTKQSVLTKYHIDPDTKKPITVPVIEKQQVHPLKNLIQMVGEVKKNKKIQIIDRDMIPVNKPEKITQPYHYYVDYEQNLIHFHPAISGQTVEYKYEDMGVTVISANKIFTKQDEKGNVIELLEDIIMLGREAIDVMETIGGVAIVMKRLEDDIKEGYEVSDKIQADIQQAKDEILSVRGNKEVIIKSSDWTLNVDVYEKEITHDLNSENLHVTAKNSDTKEAVTIGYKILDKTRILLKSDEAINMSIVLSASYYHATQTISDNIAEEVVKARKGEVDLKTKIDSIEEQLDNIAKQEYVTYEMFGAIGDGIANDYVAIKDTHNYANLYNKKVKGTYGKVYYIENIVESVLIDTDTDFSNSTFLLDEKSSNPLFISYDEEIEGLTNINLIIKGVKNIPNFPYMNSLVIIENSSIVECIREDNQQYIETEWFYIDEYGGIVGDITKTMSNYTSIKYKLVKNSYLTIENAIIKLKGNNTQYSTKFLDVRRSRTIINNISGFYDADNSSIHRLAFISINECYDVTLNNVNLPIFNSNIGSVRQGSYGLLAQYCVNLKLNNVNSPQHSDKWGVMGSNKIKNLLIEKSNLNRVDCHYYIVNLEIKDSIIGEYGITLTGYGTINLNNVTFNGDNMIVLRNDYGGFFDGDIIMDNIKWKINSHNDYDRIMISSYRNPDFDFKVGMFMCRNIDIKNIYIEKNTTKDVWLIRTNENKPLVNNNQTKPYIFDSIIAKNIRTNNTGGIKITKLSYLNSKKTRKYGSVLGERIFSNVVIDLDNVELTKGLYKSTDFQSCIEFNQAKYDFIEYTPIFDIIIKNCNRVNLYLGGAFVNTVLSNVELNFINNSNGGSNIGKCKCDNVLINPYTETTASFSWAYPSTFIDCEVKKTTIVDITKVLSVGADGSAYRTYLGCKCDNTFTNYSDTLRNNLRMGFN